VRRSIGKGLLDLIGEQVDTTPSEIPIESIQPNRNQPRQTFDDESLNELAQSIRKVGLLQPLVVRPISEDTYELVAGERRWRACQIAGLTTVPVTIRIAGQEESLALALIENIQREDISPLECALAYRRLIDEFGLTQEQLAEKVGKSRTAITNTLRLLKLPLPIQDALKLGQISEGHARAILSLDNTQSQLTVLEKVVTKGLSVRETEQAIRQFLASPSIETSRVTYRASVSATFPKDPGQQMIEEALSMKLGTPVQLKKDTRGGKIIIPFHSADELQRILDVIGIGTLS
jgi:ParB family chromosome partitioning protein